VIEDSRRDLESPTARRQAEIFLGRAPLEWLSGMLDSILAFAVSLR
jgi:hypothetical protein